MKRYISVVLIPCLLLQFVGCYSFRDITMDELKRYKGSKEVRIKTSKDEVVINRKSTGESSINWETGDSSIIVKTRKLIRDSSNTKQVTRDYEIKYQQINTIEIEEYDNLRTLALTVGIILVGIIIIAAATFNMDMDFSGMKF